MLLAVIENIIVNSSLYGSRHVFGYVFSSDKEVVDYVTTMAPFLCLSISMDSIQGTLAGNPLIHKHFCFFCFSFCPVSSMFMQWRDGQEGLEVGQLPYNETTTFRCSKRKWQAAHGSLYQSCCILSCWNPYCYYIGFCGKVKNKRERSLDRNPIRFFSAKFTSRHSNNLHKLGKRCLLSDFFFHTSIMLLPI